MNRLFKIVFGITALFIGVGFSTTAAAQEISAQMSDSLMNQSNIKGPLEFEGTAKELSKKLKGAIVTLYESPDGSHENLTEVFKTVTPGSGQFTFKLEVNKFYVLSVEKGGYTTKKIDIDTDVTMARKEHSKVPKFEFEVDMVKDLDGLEFVGSVASVFYQLKSNEFDYELDYSKEEMEDEERERREREEKARLARLAFEKKQEIEEAAKLLLDKENATAQQIIEAAITVGDGDKTKTVKGFLDVFPEVDTLREKKADIMYDKLIEERKRTEATGSKINFQAIFNSAKAYEDKVVSAAEEERQKELEVLRKEREEAEAKQEEAMAIQQKAIEVEAKEKLAAAIAEEELRQKKEEKEKRDAVYYAIFNSNGDSETAIKNLVKTYPRNDPYAEEKAKAIYVEYEKNRLTGTTLTNMDFNKLFDAASVAEQAAIREEIEQDNQKQNSRLDEFKAKVEQRKREEQQRTIEAIEEGLKDGPTDRTGQLKVFEAALPKNDPYKEQKAEAMYEEYFKQKQAIGEIEAALERTPKDKKSQIDLFFNALPEDTENRRETAERMYDNYVASMVFQKASDPAEQKKEEQLIASALPEDVAGKEQVAKNIYKDAVNASSTGNPSKESQVAAIVNNLPAGMKNKQEVAEQIYEEVVKKKQAQGGTGTVALDFAGLFGAAETAETKAQDEAKQEKAIEKRKAQEALEAKREAAREYKQEVAKKVEDEVLHVRKAELVKAKDKKERDLAKAIENGGGDRDKTVQEIVKALPTTDDKELDQERAEAVYDAYLEESAAIERSGNIGKKVDFSALFAAADRAELERLERQFQAKQAKREEELAQYEEERTERAVEIAQAKERQAEQEKLAAEKEYEETLLRTEAKKQERLAEQKREEEELAKQIAMEKAKRAAEEKERAQEELAMVEQERQKRLDREQKEQERLAAIEAEEKRKQEEEARKAAEERLAMLEKERREAEEAEQKRLADLRKEEERLARGEAKRLEAERLAAAKAAEEERKEQERLAREEERRLEAERQEQERLALEEQKRIEAEQLAAAKAAEEAKRAEEKRLEEERKEKERLALEEQKRKEEEERQRIAAEKAAAQAAEEARIAELERQEELAKKQAEEAELQRRAEYDRLVSEGDAAIAKNDFKTGWEKYKDALAMYPEEKALSKKLQDADVELQRIEQEKAEALALQQQFDAMMQDAEQELAQNNYDAAKAKFQKASDLKPDEQEPKQKISLIDRTLEQLAAEEKAKQEEERRYALLLQEGSKALEADNLPLAKEKYTEAQNMKPEEEIVSEKLNEIAEREEQLALEAEKERQRQEEAQRKYEEQQALATERAEAEAKRKEEERLRIMEELGVISDAKSQQQMSAQEQEEARLAAYDKLKQSYGESGMSEEQRRAFLSDLARIYPEGLTKETVQGKNFVLSRHVINESNVVTIYEKKTWDWGGVFYFKNSDIAITEAIYKLEIGKYE